MELHWLRHHSPCPNWTFTVFLTTNEMTWFLLPDYSSFDLSSWLFCPHAGGASIASTPGDYEKGSELPHGRSDGLLFAVAGTLNYSFLILIVLKPLWRSTLPFLYHLLHCLCRFIKFFIPPAFLSLGLPKIHFRMSWSHGSVVVC